MVGHDLPGGGFTAGIATWFAFLLLYMANGTRLVEASLSVQPVRGSAVGLVCAVATGLAAWLFGYPFLTSHSRYLPLPLIGDIPLASALLFDIGVFAVVVGTTLLMLIAIAHQSIRSPRARKPAAPPEPGGEGRSEEHTSELQSLMRNSYAVFCLKKKR